jgi:amidohydrolase
MRCARCGARTFPMTPSDQHFGEGPSSKQALLETVAALESELIAFRRDVHAHPELSGAETRTTARVAARLTAAGIAVRRLTDTGLVADIGATDPAYRVALRADLDALPVSERTGLEFASQSVGACHACGHDVHIAAVLGAGLALQKHAEFLAAQGLGVRLIFQPAEEIMPGGALRVIEQGGIAGVDAIYTVHCDPTLDVGRVGLRAGPVTSAADAITVTLSGRGGHTARPHLTQDLTYALAKVITDVPAALSRRIDPRAGLALVWGTVHSGSAENVIPSTGFVGGTLRILDAGVWQTIGPLLDEVVEAVVSPYAVSATIEHRRGVPPVVNEAHSVARLGLSAHHMLGPEARAETVQSLGGEDFAWYLQDVPGALARLGTRIPGGTTYDLHQGDLIVDERAVAIGARLLVGAVLAHRPG